MVACGHMTCALCAETMVEVPVTAVVYRIQNYSKLSKIQPGSNEFPCPFCRKQTTYIKTFEVANVLAT